MPTNEASELSPRTTVEVADLIDRFVADGGKYFSWANLARLPVDMPRLPDRPNRDSDFGKFLCAAMDEPGGYEADTLDRAFKAKGQQNEYRARLIKNGPMLAVALEQHGYNTTDLLRFIHGIDGGGGADGGCFLHGAAGGGYE